MTMKKLAAIEALTFIGKIIYSSILFKVRKFSSVALDSTLINFIFFRTYYSANKEANEQMVPLG
jgi:hypothetical protein